MYNLIDREALKRDVRDVVFAVADTPLSNDAMSKLIVKMGELVLGALNIWKWVVN